MRTPACHRGVLAFSLGPPPATFGLVQLVLLAYGAGMTVKLVVLYTQPDDGDGFDEHYLGVHGPLVEKIPGLERWEGARFVGAPDGGEQIYHRIAELYFKDQASLEAALGSEEGRATAGDYKQIAPPGSRMFAAAVDA